MQALKDDILGSRSIESIRPSDAREWAVRMKEKGFSYKTISNYKRSLKASFYMAVEDDCVRKNLFDFNLSEVIEDDSKPKVALSEEQERLLLDFMAHDTVYQKYYDDILILLKTGLRISELCGLTKSDLDFEHHTIRISHQLLNGKDAYYIDEPKTKSGNRNVPMSEETEKALQRVLKRKQKPKYREIDGYRHFLFLDSKDCPMTDGSYRSVLKNVVNKYNKSREEPLPKITPHSLRHVLLYKACTEEHEPEEFAVYHWSCEYHNHA